MKGLRNRRVEIRKGLRVIVPLLLGVAYLTLAERKVIGGIQRRRGPNAVGRYGRLTPRADGLKLLLKETIVPIAANAYRFRRAPILTFVLGLRGWAVMPIGVGRVRADRDLGLIYRLAMSSIGVYGILIAGWSSNSKYAFLGGLRSAAQMVSYEVSIGFVLVSVMRCAGTTNLTKIVRAQKEIWYGRPRRPMMRRFIVSGLAETNRHPFDLPEAEAELVSGYNVEYSAIGFALFFLGEYGNIILISGRTAVRFRGGWRPLLGLDVVPGAIWFGMKTTRILRVFIWARAGYPRYRYDQLMRLGWKVYLPRSRGWMRLTSGIMLGRNGRA